MDKKGWTELFCKGGQTGQVLKVAHMTGRGHWQVQEEDGSLAAVAAQEDVCLLRSSHLLCLADDHRLCTDP